jgi:DNA repair exonuclease SbcCD ATPase subunit
MTTTEDIRQSVDAKLDKLEAQASSIEAQLSQTREDVISDLEKRQVELQAAVDDLRSKLDETKDEGEDLKQKIRQTLDHVPVQLALAKAETRDAVEAANKQMREAANHLTSTIDGAVDEGVKTAGAECVRVADKIQAELEVLSARTGLEKAKARDDYEAQKAKILKNIDSMKTDFRKRRDMTADRLANFEQELSKAHEHVKGAFAKLVS